MRTVAWRQHRGGHPTLSTAADRDATTRGLKSGTTNADALAHAATRTAATFMLMRRGTDEDATGRGAKSLGFLKFASLTGSVPRSIRFVARSVAFCSWIHRLSSTKVQAARTK